jgi:outer membrane protein insertion porin family
MGKVGCFRGLWGILTLTILLCLSCIEPARSAEPSPPTRLADLEGKPIRSLAVISPRGFSSEDIRQITGIKIGEPYTPMRIRRGLERLYRTGNFRDILVEAEPQANGIQVTFTLVDKPTIAQLRLKGNQNVSSNELQRVMQIKIGDEFTNSGWKAALARLLNYYRQQGFLRARVASETSAIEQENRVVLNAEIQEGQRARVREIRFHGEHVFPPSKLKTIIKTTAGGPYQPEQLGDDLKALDQFYVQEGYLKATIGPPNITYHERDNEVTIHLPIDAGTQLKVIFEGNGNIPSETLKGQLSVWEERSDDPGVLEESTRRLERFYQSQGYLFAKAEYQVDDRVKGQAVTVKFKISEGKKVTIESIVIQGNQAISSQEIRKIMRTKESGLFTSTVLNRAVLDDDQNSILRLYHSRGYLDANVEESIRFNRDKTKLSITLQINEGPQIIVRKILFSGNSALSDEDLLKAVVLKEGMPYDEAQTRLDRFNLLALYAQNGYLSTQIDLKPTLSEDKRSIKLVYQIEER